MRASVVLICVVVLVGVTLGYRQWTLERRIDELTAQLGATSAAQDEPAEHADVAPEANPSSSHADRLRTLESQVASLRADLHTLEQATGEMAKSPVSDQQILSVMKQQGSKVLESQLKFHRDRWLDQREAGLNDFSRRFGLSQKQNDELWELLADEIDTMTNILRRPDLAENPERAASEWKQVLVNTDEAAHRILDTPKSTAWDQTRYLERNLLWPWLPE